MKKWLLFLLLTTFFSKVNAQVEHAYQPMAIESAKWFVYDVYQLQGVPPPWNYEYRRALYGISGDTTINNIQYKKVYEYFPNTSSDIDSLLIGVMRDDTEARTVHFLFFDQSYFGYGCAFECTANVEMTLYDFSLNFPTDSLVDCPNGYGYAIAVETSYQFMYGKTRKVIKTNRASATSADFFWYEGIGGQTSPFSRFANGYLNGLPSYTLDHYCVGSFEDCGVVEFLTSNENISSILPDVKLFPNPSSHFLNIELPITGLDISIINTVGKVIINGSNLDLNSQVDISSYPNGIYYIQFFKNHQLLKTEKFVVLK